MSINPFEQKVRQKAQEYLKLEKEELATRLAYFEVCIDQMGNEVKYFLNNMFQLLRGLRRDYIPIEGILIGVRFELKEFLLWRDTKTEPYGKNIIIHEQLITHAKPTSFLYWEIIPLHEEKPKQPQPTQPQNQINQTI